jgi:hypothetical protein
MKNRFVSTFVVLLTCCLTTAFAQVNISCDSREICKYNAETEDFEDCNKYEEHSIFKINADETMFIHTTETIKSAYYIKEKTQDEDGIWTLTVQSDVGNNYIYFLDLKNDQVVVAAKIDDELKMIKFHVKKVWTEE